MITYDRKLVFVTAILIVVAVGAEVVPFAFLKWHEYTYEHECKKTCQLSGKAPRVFPLNPNAVAQPGQTVAAWTCACV